MLMFHRWCYILILTISPSAFTQVLDTMYFDNSWEQTGLENAYYYRIVSVDSSGDFRLYVEDHYPGGQIQMTGTYKSIQPDDKDGHFVYWYEDGNKQMDCYYRDNLLHGPLREWYPSGLQKSYQEFSYGLLNGENTSWREDGSLKLKARYYKGEKHGNFQTFYPDGRLLRDDFFENGELVEGHCYSPEGDPVDYFPYVIMPEFPGGHTALKRFVDKELKYPQEARKKGIEGTVIVLFTVDENGKVKDPEIVNGDLEYFNEEALRVVREFPDWIPGKVDGTLSSVQVSLPIDFRFR